MTPIYYSAANQVLQQVVEMKKEIAAINREQLHILQDLNHERRLRYFDHKMADCLQYAQDLTGRPAHNIACQPAHNLTCRHRHRCCHDSHLNVSY